MSSARAFPRVISSSAWPEADALFHSDPRWRGSDDAYTVPLGPDRTLWLFGDTFIARTIGVPRAECAFIRNSLGIQTGSDPSTATIEFVWDESEPEPHTWLRAPGETWYWPLHGAMVNGQLFLFMMWVRSPVAGTGAIDEWRDLGALSFFDVFGWSAFRVADPLAHPRDWTIEKLADTESRIALGAANFVQDQHLVSFGWDAEHRLYLGRWKLDQIATEPEWWDGSTWAKDAEPAVVIEKGSTEFTIHREGDLWCNTQLKPDADGFWLRWAERLEGPWSEPEVTLRPSEMDRTDAFVYAGKAHPELTGADLVLTYASNASVDVCLADESIYYPRFGRVSLERP
jgi:hypothetical protein